MSGTGRVAGSLRVAEEGNVRFVEERPCSVNGRSRSREGSDGPVEAVASSTDGASAACSFAVSCVRLSRRFSGLSIAAVAGRGEAFGEPSLAGIRGSPGLEKASLKAGLPSMWALEAWCLDGVTGSRDRDWPRRFGESANSMSESWWRKCSMRHFCSRTGCDTRREKRCWNCVLFRAPLTPLETAIWSAKSL